MSRVYFGLSGSDANETNIKLVWYMNNVLGRPEKEEDRLALARLSRLRRDDRLADRARALPQGLRPAAGAHPAHRSALLLPPRGSSQSEEDFSQHCADRLEALIQAEGPETVAAFIAEPILGTGGIVPPPAGYWPKIQAVLEKVRRAADRRRGGDRLRAPRLHVRQRPLRHDAGHHHRRQGPDQRLRAALRLHRVGKGLGGARTGLRRLGADSATAGPIRPIRSAPRRASPMVLGQLARASGSCSRSKGTSACGRPSSSP